MAVTEQSRRRLHRELANVMGEEGATLVVEHLPPMDWTDLATKEDLAATEAELRAEIAMVRSELAAGFVLVNERFKTVEARLAQHEELFATKADVLALSAQLHQELRRMTQTLLFGSVGLVAAMASVVGVVAGT